MILIFSTTSFSHFSLKLYKESLSRMILNQQSECVSDLWPILLLNRIPGLRKSSRRHVSFANPRNYKYNKLDILKSMYESLLMQSLLMQYLFLNHRSMNIGTEF